MTAEPHAGTDAMEPVGKGYQLGFPWCAAGLSLGLHALALAVPWLMALPPALAALLTLLLAAFAAEDLSRFRAHRRVLAMAWQRGGGVLRVGDQELAVLAPEWLVSAGPVLVLRFPLAPEARRDGQRRLWHCWRNRRRPLTVAVWPDMLTRPEQSRLRRQFKAERGC